MADVRRVLDDPAARCPPRSWPAPRSAGCRACGTRRPRRDRRLGVVDAADHRGEGERQRERQVRQDWSSAVEPRQRRPRDDAMASAGRRRPSPRARRPPSQARPRRPRAPASTAANAPGTPRAAARRRRGSARTITRATRPTRGSPKTLSAGRNAMSRMATPAIEPSSAARGTTRRTQSPANASASLKHAHGDRHAHADLPGEHRIAGERASPGPSTPNTMAKSDGVSMPNGIAVTSARPVRRMSRTRQPRCRRGRRRARRARCPGTMT